MPVRKIPKNYRNLTGKIASDKAIGGAFFESTLERDFYSLLDFRQDVKDYEVQPARIPWVDAEGKERFYTPDVFVTHKFSPKARVVKILYEVKYRSDLREHWIELRPKFKAALAFCRKYGFRFKIITEKEIRTPLLENAKFLLTYRRLHRGQYREASEIDFLVLKMRELKVSTPKGLLEASFKNKMNQAKLIPVMWYLIQDFKL